jgi:hypothetical protein
VTSGIKVLVDVKCQCRDIKGYPDTAVPGDSSFKVLLFQVKEIVLKEIEKRLPGISALVRR